MSVGPTCQVSYSNFKADMLTTGFKSASNMDKIKTLGHNSGFSLEYRMEGVVFNEKAIFQSLRYRTELGIHTMKKEEDGPRYP